MESKIDLQQPCCAGREKMMHKYAGDVQSVSLPRNRRKTTMYNGMVIESNRKEDLVSEGVHKVQVKHDNLDARVNRIIREAKGMTDDDDPIDKKVLKKYLQEIKESEGFDFSEFPGSIEGVTDIFPCQSLLENRESRPEEYDQIMYLATLAIATYNKKHETEFKVVEIEKLNVVACRDFDYYITFSGVEVKGKNKQIKGSLWTTRGVQWIIMILLPFLWCFLTSIEGRQSKMRMLKLKREWNLKYLKASEHELHEEEAGRCTTFRALVIDNVMDVKQRVLFCKAL